MINILNELRRMIKNNNHISVNSEIWYLSSCSSNKHTNLELNKMLHVVDKLYELKDLLIFKDNVIKIDILNESLREYKNDYNFFVTIYLKDNIYLCTDWRDYEKTEVIFGFGKRSLQYDRYIKNNKKINYWCAPSLMEYYYFEPNWKKFKNRIRRYTNKLCRLKKKF
jgi:hypothetical protein